MKYFPVLALSKPALLFVILFVATLLSACGGNEITAPAESATATQNKARNIIFMVGDGMGLPQVSAAMLASNRELNLERASIIGLIKTASSKEQITDSAAGATAFAIGKKTKNGAIGIDQDGRTQVTILEELGNDGYATGLIATSSITHATPASFFSHQASRKMAYRIAADMVTAPVHLFIGGGKKHFENRDDPQVDTPDQRNIIDELKAQGFSFVDNVKSLRKTQGKVGFFLADGHPEPAAKGRGDILPKLIAPSIGSLQKQSDKGFFLMVEGSQIDWGGHENKQDYVISELVDFDEAVGRALDFAEADGNTLVVITADHETGGLTLPAADKDRKNPYKKAAPMFSTQGHTATMVPVYAYGPGAELFSGVYDNTEIHSKLLDALSR